MFTGGAQWHNVEGVRDLQRFVRLLVPTPDEGTDEAAIDSLVDVLSGIQPRTRDDAKEFWNDALVAISATGVEWQSDHKASLTVQRGVRRHRVTVYAYAGSIRAVGVVADNHDHLANRGDWGSNPRWGRCSRMDSKRQPGPPAGLPRRT